MVKSVSEHGVRGWTGRKIFGTKQKTKIKKPFNHRIHGAPPMPGLLRREVKQVWFVFSCVCALFFTFQSSTFILRHIQTRQSVPQIVKDAFVALNTRSHRIHSTFSSNWIINISYRTGRILNLFPWAGISSPIKILYSSIGSFYLN